MKDLIINEITDMLYFGDDSWFNLEKSNFQDVGSSNIDRLIFFDILDPNKKISLSDYCPTVVELAQFLREHPNFSCYGRVFLHDDCHIVIDGIYCAKFNDRDKLDFELFSMMANIVRENDLFLYCRW